MTVDWRQNPDRTLVRGTRISGYRKLQCNYYKCVKQTHSQSGVRKRSKNCCVSCLLFGLFSSTPREAHSQGSLTSHTRTQTQWREHEGRVSEGNIRVGSVKGTLGEGQYRDAGRMGGKWRGWGSSPGYLGELRPDRTGIRDRRLRGLGLYEFIDLIIEKFEESWFFKFFVRWLFLYPTILFWFYLAESSRSLSIEGKWDDLPLDRRLSLELKIFSIDTKNIFM